MDHTGYWGAEGKVQQQKAHSAYTGVAILGRSMEMSVIMFSLSNSCDQFRPIVVFQFIF